MAKATLFLAVTLIAALLVLWLTLPHASAHAPAVLPPDSSTNTAPSPVSPDSGTTIEPAIPSSPAPVAPTPSTPLDARTPQQKTAEALEAQRGSFYASLRQQLGPALADVLPTPNDAQTLEFYAAQDDPQFVTLVVAKALPPQAARYGFRKARIYLPNPPDAAERYRLDTEATCDAQNHWNAFKK